MTSLRMQLTILIATGCLLGLASAACNPGCINCAGSVCYECSVGYYWSTYYRDCVSLCSGYIDRYCQIYGGSGVCYYSYYGSPCSYGLGGGIITAIVLPIVFALLCVICCVSVATTKRRRRLRRARYNHATNTHQNTNPADLVVVGIPLQENPQRSNRAGPEIRNVEIEPVEVLDKEENDLVQDKGYPILNTDVKYAPTLQTHTTATSQGQLPVQEGDAKLAYKKVIEGKKSDDKKDDPSKFN